jgi:hypothetical protein
LLEQIKNDYSNNRHAPIPPKFFRSVIKTATGAARDL